MILSDISAPLFIKGKKHTDERGSISFTNSFSLLDFKRFYITSNNENQDVRAWQGHRKEYKAFHCIEGDFVIGLVKIDNWKKPSENLKTELFSLSDNNIGVLIVPPGFASGIKSLTKENKLLIYSDKTLEESLNDDFRYDKNKWIAWSKI